ncbi:MAG TPA: cyclase family protein [Solirubrobacterales bacterium]|nr:cyclase family protein [Solirubrobacterales bacterium]
MRIKTDKLWDLSQPLAHDGPAWAEFDPPSITRNYRCAAEGYNLESVQLKTHMGTHVDVPFHYYDDGATVDQMPLEAFAAPAAFLDLRAVLAADQAIEPEQLRGSLDLLREGDIAVLVTGWGEKRGVNEDFLKRWPYLGGPGAELLLERGASGVGIDALSIGGWGSAEKGDPSHVVLLSAGKPIVEDLRIPAELIGRRCFLTAFPVLLEGCSGAWTRAVAWELDDGAEQDRLRD